MRGGRTEDRERAPRGMTQPALAGLGVTLARLAGLFGMLITSRGPETLYVLSRPYELLGDKRVSSAELMVKLQKSAGPKLGSNAQCAGAEATLAKMLAGHDLSSMHAAPQPRWVRLG